ncbi:hypothetical protein WMY93_009612 [Mugilogobius chulae]|uniref:G-protein coupled receptors family 1 profile domain-containing protein n=1 Tax=Mugilogobius chulae TaxID=88201 RepID=A0AAW0PL14_9GOBI
MITSVSRTPAYSSRSSHFCIISDRMELNQTLCAVTRFDFFKILLTPVYILVFIVGLSANIWVLKFLLQNWEKFGNINVFVLNLGLSDLLYLLTLPFLVVYHFKGRKWIFGDTFCKITRFCFCVNLYGSIGFLTCISVYRYLSIVYPMKILGRLTSSHSIIISILVWLLVGAQTLPDMFFEKTYLNTSKCYDTTSEPFVEDYLTYSMIRTMTGFCLPFLITSGCYIHVIMKLCSSSSRNTDPLLKRRSLKLLLVLILLFSVCYIPDHILRNLNLWVRVLAQKKQCYSWFNTVYVAHQVGRGLVCLNSALNPLVYLHVSEELSTGLRTLRTQAHLLLSLISWSPVSASERESD